jgi:flagellar biosynthesis protein FlhF
MTEIRNEIRTYKAESMQEALAIVRRELGTDAVILNTRQITRRRLLPFLKKRQVVEVTAGVSVEKRPAPLAMPSESSQSAVNRAASFRSEPVTSEPISPAFDPGLSRQPALRTSPAASGPVSNPDTPLARATALALELERRNADKAQLEKSLHSLEAAAATEKSKATPQRMEPPTTGIELSIPLREQASRVSPSLEQPSAPPTRTSAEPIVSNPRPANQAAGLQAAALARFGEGGSANELSVKLDVLQKMVESLAQRSHSRNADEVPSELFGIYTQLIDADIDDDLARELICSLKQHCTSEQLHDPVGSRALLSAMVEVDIRCAPPIRPEVGRRRVVALVGPTGVGKTTTIAKLAANFRLRDGIRMGLVTVDTYRIAAVEQLRTYAEIIDLPMKVVTSPQEMRRALDDLSDLDLILIDTAGRSPRDELKIQELKSLLNEACVDEVHLVMSLTASVRSIRMTCEQFRSVNPTALILTKLDEAAGMGSLLSISRDVKLPFSYLTTGQDVPEDIEPANQSRIARLVLGEDRLFD